MWLISGVHVHLNVLHVYTKTFENLVNLINFKTVAPNSTNLSRNTGV